MSAARILLLGLCGVLAGTSSALALQSCPNPTGYDASPPVRLIRPGVLGPMSVSRTAAVTGSIATLSGDYYPADLLGWTASPSACDASSSTDAPCGAHRVYVPAASVTPREPLVVFLPGSSMTPSSHDLVLKTAAYAGYRTIGLSYDSTNNVDSLCSTFFGTHRACFLGECYASKRDEIILGIDLDPDLDVQPADSILERLFTLLAGLYVDDMSDGVNDHGWDAYFSPLYEVPFPIRASNVAWDNIIIAGFSQGSGHAARISKEYLVHGTIMIDGPGDMCYEGWPAELVPAPWMDGPDASAGTPRYGAMHAMWSDEFGLDDGQVPPTWEAMGLPEDGLVVVDPDDAGSRLTPGLDPLVPGGAWDGTGLSWLQPPAQAMATAQEPAGVDAQCLQIPSVGLPLDTSQKHGSMADDRCMPTTLTGGELATQPDDAYLFRHYLKRFCYACDEGVCP